MYVAGLRWDTHNAAGPGDGSTGIGWHPLVRSDGRLRRAAPGGAVMAQRRPTAAGRWALACALAVCAALSRATRARAPRSSPEPHGDARVPLAAAAALRRHRPHAAPSATAARSALRHRVHQLERRRRGRRHARAGRAQRRPGSLGDDARRGADGRRLRAAAGRDRQPRNRRGGRAAVRAARPVRRGHARATTATATNAYQGLAPAWHVRSRRCSDWRRVSG